MKSTRISVVIVTALALSLSSCSQFSGLGDDLKKLAPGVSYQAQAPTLPVTEPGGENAQPASMEDTEVNRKNVALAVEKFYTSIAQFSVADDNELLEVEKNPGQYARIKTEQQAGVQFVTGEDGKDIEDVVSELSPEKLDELIQYNERFNPEAEYSNFYDLNPVQKVVSQMMLGDYKTLFNYQYRLHKIDTPTKFTLDPSRMIFRDNDIIVNVPAGMVINQGEISIDYLPLRVIISDGRYVVDVFNCALLNYSPINFRTLFMGEKTPDTDAAEIVDETLTRAWKTTPAGAGLGR